MKTSFGVSSKVTIVLVVLIILILSMLIFLVFLDSGNINIKNFVSLFQKTPTQQPVEQVFHTSTEPKPIATKIILPVFETTPKLIIKPTDKLQYPLSYTYEGGTIKCECHKCICVTKQDFRVRLTIEQDGVVFGVFEQYLPDFPDMDIVGDKSYIYGTVKDTKNYGDSIEFNGKLSDNLNILDVVIYFRGENHYGNRIILLYKQ